MSGVRWAPWASRRLIAFCCTAGLLCAPVTVSGGAIPAGFSKEQLFGTTLRKAKWDRMQIEVCWDNPDKLPDEQRDFVKSTVAGSWEKASGVHFVGWQSCQTSDAKGLHIILDNDQPWAEAVGIYLDGRPGGLHLNLDVTNWRPACAADAQKCRKAVIVHEFGHVLGFTHEQRKEGAPAECSSEPNDIVGDYLVTRYDPSSVMALCNPDWMGGGDLSSLDRQAVQRFYSA